MNNDVKKTHYAVPQRRLTTVSVSYYNFEGTSCHEGHLVVLDAAASYVQTIFTKLYERKFPLTSVRPIADYNNEDERSMEANNTSCYQGRLIAGSDRLSLHAYGLAIDLNPQQNPYLRFDPLCRGRVEVSPPQGVKYLNRSNRKPGMITCAVVTLFAEHGFRIWGGRWNDPIDWHHFQTPRSLAQTLAVMSPEHAKLFFSLYVRFPKLMDRMDSGKENDEFNRFYAKDPSRFLACIQAHPEILQGPSTRALSVLRDSF